jgi:hypothetical protein
MSKFAFWLIILAGLVAVGACSSTPAATTEPEQEATPVPSDTPVPPTPEPTLPPEPKELPDTPVSAVLGVEPNTTYKVELGTFVALPFEESDLPAAPGDVTAQWYIAGDSYVVAYAGLDYAEGDLLCPGNSILTGAGFLHVSNAPTDEGACEGFPTLTSDSEVGPVVCQGTLLYVTAIPSTEQGMLFGTLEALTADGGLIGLTSAVESSLDIPVIDLEEFCG